MKTLLVVFALGAILVGCENMYDDGGIPRIRSQKQVDAYNATVSSESEKLVCTREKPLGSNLPQFVCMTIAQQERFAIQARDNIELIGRGNN
ncbi:MAG: hypothetical protein HQ498_10410 [Pseudohongiella sp.]|jgi:hypothetical protein|nr:hypothetical protein [Pseudohongiella sp.]